MKVHPALSEAGVEHQGFWSVIVLAVLILSGFAGFFTLAAGAPGSNPARAPASDTPVGDSGLQSFLAGPILEVAATSLTAVALTWTAPTNNGGSTITGYAISLSTNNGVTWSAKMPISGSIASFNHGVNLQTGPAGQV